MKNIQDITDVIVSIAQNVILPGIDLPTNMDMTFDDIGIDSLDVSTILLEVEEKFEIKIPDEVMDQVNTLNNLVNFVHNKN